jgi:hypothetical protein
MCKYCSRYYIYENIDLKKKNLQSMQVLGKMWLQVSTTLALNLLPIHQRHRWSSFHQYRRHGWCTLTRKHLCKFYKIWNDAHRRIRGLGEDYLWKNLKSGILWHCSFNPVQISWSVFTNVSAPHLLHWTKYITRVPKCLAMSKKCPSKNTWVDESRKVYKRLLCRWLQLAQLAKGKKSRP